MEENKKYISLKNEDNKDYIIKELSTFLKELPYDFTEIKPDILVNKYKREIIRVK